MLNEILSLASYGYFDGSGLGQMLAQWQQAGVFSYMIPFLLIFALVFGILSKMNLFGSKKDLAGTGTENRSINAIIALAVAFMSLQFDFVSVFFSEVFPRMGVALGIILVILVVGGLFIDPKNKGFMIGLMVIAMLIAGGVIIYAVQALGWGTNFFYGSWWMMNNSWVVPTIILIMFIVVIVIGAKPKSTENAVGNLVAQALGVEGK